MQERDQYLIDHYTHPNTNSKSVLLDEYNQRMDNYCRDSLFSAIIKTTRMIERERSGYSKEDSIRFFHDDLGLIHEGF